MAEITPSRRRAVHLAGPAVVVALLGLLAMWRVGGPGDEDAIGTAGTSGSPAAGIAKPITRVVDVFTENVIGREATLERVEVRARIAERAFWVGSGDDKPVLAVLAPGVNNPGVLTAGAPVTLTGTVEAAPSRAELQAWGIDDAAAWAVEDAGVYLRVEEVRR